MPKSLQGTRYFWILLLVTISGLSFSIYWTLSNEYVPINKNTIFHNGTDLDAIVTVENYTKVPLQSFFNPKIANVTVEIYFKKLPTFLKGIKLSSNGSSILTTSNETFTAVNKFQVPNKPDIAKEIQNNKSEALSAPIPTSPRFSASSSNLTKVEIKQVEASTYQAPNLPNNTIDNKLDTRWSALGDPQSITYTFDKRYNISAIGISFYNANLRQYSFEINGQRFNSSTNGATSQNFTLKTPVTSTHNLTIIGHGSSENLWNSYNEVTIYGKVISAINPVPSITADSSTVAAVKYTVRLNMGHPLVVGNFSDQYTVNLFYRKVQDTGNILVDKIPFIWRIQTMDWSIISYFWILFAGVLLSRMFTFRGQNSVKSNLMIKFEPLELAWVPFSAIITLLILSSFMNQLFHSLTPNILLNLALTFAFGFGFDKILEVWQKSPGLDRQANANAGGAANNANAGGAANNANAGGAANNANANAGGQ